MSKTAQKKNTKERNMYIAISLEISVK